MTETSAAAETAPPITHHTIPAADGKEIDLRVWQPTVGEPAGVVQILHGLGEHIDRYARFAAAANERGLLVVGHNHRGHGERAIRRGSFGDRDGWKLLEADALVVRDHIDDLAAGTPLVLLGHSMGSFLAQTFAMHYGGRIKGLLLSGSTWPAKTSVLPGRIAASVVALRTGRNGSSPFLDDLGFGAMNRRFAPNRTEFDWLSRDEAEVDRYVDDPLCGGPFTAGLWADMLGGMSGIGADSAITRIPSDLPILISGGSDDPVGGENGMGALMLHYAQTMHSRLKLKIYPEGRHEMLNEINRDEVTADWLDWIDGVVRR